MRVGMTRTLRDYYDVLGVGRQADAARIKQAFRSHARRFHPDVSSEPDAESRFVELVEAYEVLSNPRSRLLYDHIGLGRWRRGFAATPRPHPAAAPERIVAEVALEHWQAVAGAQVPLRYTVERRCSHCTGSGADPAVPRVPCETCSGSGRIRRRLERADVDLLQLYVCPDCGGSGRGPGASCPECGGAGTLATERELRLAVPAGVRDGDRLRVDGVEGQISVTVLPRPAERRAVRLLAIAALFAAVALLVYVLVS
jgi:molecular chaperone DnaJ